MSNLFMNDEGELMAEIAGTEIPFDYLTGYGVLELVRVSMGQEPLCVAEARGTKGKTNDGQALAKMASKLITPEGMEALKNHHLAGAKPLKVEAVTPDVPEEDESAELERLIAEQEQETFAMSP